MSLQTINILLVEDQNLVRDALHQLLNLQPQFNVVAAVENGAQAKDVIATHNVDLVLTDIEMPVCDGLSLCEWLTEKAPCIRTVILTTYNRSGYLKRAVKAGAKGFVLKEVGVDKLVQTLFNIQSGGTYYDMELVLAGLNEEDPLTEREKQALRLAEEGLSTTKIAETMHLSHGTIRNYLSEAIGKLYANSRSDAARIAREKGWL